MDNNEIFWIKATRCRRCGGILTSKKAVELGYGCLCARKARIASAPPPPEQVTFDELEVKKEMVSYGDG